MAASSRGQGWAVVAAAATLAALLTSMPGLASAATQSPEPASAGIVTTIAGGTGGPGPATTVALQEPCGLAAGDGTLYVGDGGNSVVQGVSEHSGRLAAAAGTGVQGTPGGVAPATSTNVGWPCTIAVDRAGNLLLAQTDEVLAVAHTAGTFYGVPMVAGDIYRIIGTGTQGFSGDGGPARNAELEEPDALAVDHVGNVVIADALRLRVVAARSGTFYGRRMKAGDIYTIGGGGKYPVRNGQPAANAQLHTAAIAVDAAGNLVIADESDHRIVVLPAASGTFYGQRMRRGRFYIVAGDGHAGFAGDGGPAVTAGLGLPVGVAIGQSGSLVIADQAANRLRMVAARTGSYYGRRMRAGHIYTIAGTGADGIGGDGGPAAKAQLDQPNSVASDSPAISSWPAARSMTW